MKLGVVLASLGISAGLLAGCPHERPVIVVDAAAPTTSVPAYVPELLDAGVLEEPDAGPDGGGRKLGGSLDEARVLECCRAIKSQVKDFGGSPEAALFEAAFVTCEGVAGQLDPRATGVELAPVRDALKRTGKPIPAVCN